MHSEADRRTEADLAGLTRANISKHRIRESAAAAEFQFVLRSVMWVNYHQDKGLEGCEQNPWMF
jgi:hypothetical protein